MGLRRTELLFLCLALCLCAVSPTRVVLEGSAFKGVLVAFAPDVAGSSSDRRLLLTSTEKLLSESSTALSKATGLYFGDVTFLIPQSWETPNQWTSSEVSPSTGMETVADADIVVDATANSVFGADPFTYQHAGCGEPGLKITIPKDFLLKQDVNVASYNKAQLIVREWVRYRYGVFDEGGFPGDERYPLYYSVPGSDGSDVRVTECTHQQAKYIFRDNQRNPCTMKIDVNTGLPANDSDCRLLPDSSKNEDVTSSLMYRFPLPKVSYFCDDEEHHHNSRSPNKQNVICGTKSVWNVIKSHDDFKGKEPNLNVESSPKPSFRYVQEGDFKVAIALDQSEDIGEEKGFLIKNAVMKFIYDLPEGTKCGVIKYSDVAKTTLDLVPLTQDRKTAAEKVTPIFDKPADASCTECALQEALNMLNKDDDSGRRMLILITSTKPESIDSLTTSIQTSKPCLRVILFSTPQATKEDFNALLETSPCSLLWEIQSELGSTEILLRMYDMFSSIIQWNSWKIPVITLKTSPLSFNSEVSFDTDSTVESLTLWLTSPDSDGKQMPNILEEEDISLEANGVITKSSIEVSPMPAYIITVTEVPENANWKCSLTKQAKTPLLLLVTARPPQTKDLLTVRAWIKDTSQKGNTLQQPVIIYAEVTVGRHPVVDADVTAIVHPPSKGEDKSFNLFDNGLGDPDVTQNDGIYSRYFTDFTKDGEYIVDVVVKNDKEKTRVARASTDAFRSCCGSVVAVGEEVSTGSFTRETTVRFTAISEKPQNGYKPSKIFDLRVARIGMPRVSLQWTAPGNEMDSGTVEKYDLKMFLSQEDAQKNFDSPDKSIPHFETQSEVIPYDYPAMQKVEILLKLPSLESNKSYFFAVRPTNKLDNQGDISNVVEIFIPGKTTSDNKEIQDEQKTAGQSSTIGIVVGVAVAILALAICGYVAFYVCYIRPRRKAEDDNRERREDIEEDDYDKPVTSNPIFTISDEVSADRDNQTDDQTVNRMTINDIELNHNDSFEKASTLKMKDFSSNQNTFTTSTPPTLIKLNSGSNDDATISSSLSEVGSQNDKPKEIKPSTTRKQRRDAADKPIDLPPRIKPKPLKMALTEPKGELPPLPPRGPRVLGPKVLPTTMTDL